jgi:cysteine sulfinate desulfinase/cysteine desulfurase-like protein
MGLNEDEAFSSVRFSFSGQNNLAEVDLAVSTLLSALERLNGHTIGNFTDVGMIRHEV